MQVYIVVNQGYFVEVFSDKKDAEALQRSIEMGGGMGVAVIPKVVK